MRSVYHTREVDVARLLKLSREDNTIFLSHDWPLSASQCGDQRALLRKKPFFKDEVASNTLGSPCLENLLKNLKPDYWFSSHMHVKHKADIVHNDDTVTKFLALDKVLMGRDFYEIVEISSNYYSPLKIRLDVEWLALVRLSFIRPDLLSGDVSLSQEYQS
jgi:lariat debranching enzyme